jgi:4'-phosphopantetheinyl transferase EntD
MDGATGATVQPSARLASLFRNLASGPVVAMELWGSTCEAPPYPEEARLVQRAVAKRRREFAGGRQCARRALAELGIRDFPLLVGEDRFPLWPRGVVGSITHADDFCAAVATPLAVCRGIGVDVEKRGRIEAALEREICTDEELRWLRSRPKSRRADLATLIFSAKEAFYKCQYCITRKWVGFQDVTLEIGHGCFAVRLLEPSECFPGRQQPLVGRCFIGTDHVFAGIALEAHPSASQ